jgi:anti-anti-sigma regulatory factor
MQRSPVAGLPLLILFGFSWLIHIGVLTVAFIRHPPARLSIGLLIGAVVISTLSGAFSILPGIQPPLITIALAYAVLRGRLLTPTRVGIEQAVRAMDNLMLVFDKDRRITFANPIAERLGLADGAQALLTLDHRQQEYVQLDERRILFNYTPLTDNRGSQLGILALGRDTTELEQQAHELERERARLAETVQQLRAEQFERAQLADTVRGLEFPVIPALPGVIILPLVGTLDDARTDEFIGVLLKSIERERADLVLLDITGVPLLDTQGAQTLLNGVRSARLLGARCILAGVRPEIAQALVTLGVNLSEMGTSATLQQALQREIAASGKRRNHA